MRIWHSPLFTTCNLAKLTRITWINKIQLIQAGAKSDQGDQAVMDCTSHLTFLIRSSSD